MTGPAMEIKLYYIELLKEHFPERHVELMKEMEAKLAETKTEKIPPKKQETEE